MINVPLIVLVIGAILLISIGFAIGVSIYRKHDSAHKQQETDAINESAFRKKILLDRISQEFERLRVDQAQLLSSLKKILLLEKNLQTTSIDDKSREELDKVWGDAKRQFIELGKRFNAINALLVEIANVNKVELAELEKLLNIYSDGGPVFVDHVDNRGGYIQGRLTGDSSTDAPPPPPKSK